MSELQPQSMGILDDTWKTVNASHCTWFNVATLHRFLLPQKLFVSISDSHRPKKRRDAKDADGSCLCAQERLCDMWLWDCRGSHQHFEKHVAWLLSTNWDVTLGGWKPFFSWNTLILEDMDLIWRALLLHMFSSNLVGWKKHQLKNWIAVSSTCDQRGSFRPFFV